MLPKNPRTITTITFQFQGDEHSVPISFIVVKPFLRGEERGRCATDLQEDGLPTNAPARSQVIYQRCACLAGLSAGRIVDW